MTSIFLCLLCVFGFISGAHNGWPVWTLALLAIGAVISFIAGKADDE